jgi:predicted ArsR family transcriptional regulator
MATFSLQPESPRAVSAAAGYVGVNEGVNDLIQLITEHPGLRANALAARLSTSVKNVERWLKQLKDQGHIEFRGVLIHQSN